MRIKTFFKLAAATLIAGFTAQQAYAWDGVTSGTIIGVEVNNGQTRIYFSGHPVFCTGGNRYAHVIPSDPNYAVFVSTALSAMALKTPMTVYTNFTDGQCRIGTMVAGSSPF